MTPPVYATLFVSLAIAIVLAAWIIARHLGASRHAQAALTASEEYRGLADEYRRLSDMAITAQEHADLRLADLSVRIDEVRDKLDQMQRILKEVE
jgi:hypothetical protein